MILPWLLVLPLAGLFMLMLAYRAPVVQAALIGLMSVVSLGLAVTLALGEPGVVSYAVGGWEPPLGIVLTADALSRLMLLLTGVLFTAAAAYHLGQTLLGAPPTGNPLYHFTFPLLLLGLNGVFLTGDLFNFYVFFELVAVVSYLLVSLGRHWPLEAAWKYSAQSVVGSLFLLTGICLVYGRFGALTMAEVARALGEPVPWVAPFFLVAFFLKGAIFPFHFWQPDAHAAATTVGSTLLAGLLIKVGMYGLFRFWPLLMGESDRGVFIVLGIATLLFGAIAAFRENDAKRLLGFSSISQLGFVLLGLGWGTAAALGGALFYLVNHSLSKALLFVATGSVTDRAGTTRLPKLPGAGKGLPWVAAAYLVGALSLVGLPPTAGFVAKLALLHEGARLGDWFGVGVIVLGSLMTLGYGLKTFQQLFWGPERSPLPGRRNPGGAWTLALLTLLVVLNGLMPATLYGLCRAGAEDVERLRLVEGPRP